MAKDFFKQFIVDIGDDETTLSSDGLSAAEFGGFVDSGSLLLNAAFSGDLFGGLPDNKALVFAGDPGVGKTFFALSIIKGYMERNPRARVAYFDTEAAVTNEMFTDRGIDPSRIMKSEPKTIEHFRTVCMKVIDTYLALDEKERFPLLIVLDSLGAMPSAKEVADVTQGNETKDMTKPGILKGAFRVLRLKLAKAQIPMIVTNHVYASMNPYGVAKVQAGGSGSQYAADMIAMLSKSKEKDADKNLIGNIITATMVKSRLTKEGTKVQTRVMFDGGLDRYYGLIDLGEAAGVIKRVGNKYEFPDGTKAASKTIESKPETFFTKDVLDQINVYVKDTFRYNGTSAPIDVSALEEVEA